MEAITLTSAHDRKYYNLAFGLAIFTILYNFAEGIIATWLGYEDETLALFGFGVDSFIELISGVGIMQMVIRIRQHPDSPRGNFEKTALRVTGYSFYLLVAGLVITAVLNLYRGHKPETTFWGVVIASISIVVMLVLIYGKIKTGRALHSAAILADANCTKVCIYMSLVLLASSAIYEYTDFAYADSLGTLGLAWFSYQEGKECFDKANNVECSCEHHH
ncbi:MAG: cation transporter [Bacteroidota bacterium]